MQEIGRAYNYTTSHINGMQNQIGFGAQSNIKIQNSIKNHQNINLTSQSNQQILKS